MRIFLAGAAGAVGRRLVPLLLRDGHTVTGSTRSAERAKALAAEGIAPAVVDFTDREAAIVALVAARPEVVIHQLTDLPRDYDPANREAMLRANARLRIVGTENLVAGAVAAGARRIIAQSVAFAYAPGPEPHGEDDPLNVKAEGVAGVSANGAATLERLVLAAPGIAGVVLRYGLLYGPGTWRAAPAQRPALHVDAAAEAAALAVSHGSPGTYNIAEEDGVVSIDKAKAGLGFDPGFRFT